MDGWREEEKKDVTELFLKLKPSEYGVESEHTILIFWNYDEQLISIVTDS